MKLRILDSAIEDLDRGRRFYERQGEGLGAYFLDSLFAEIDSLVLYGGIHRKVFGYHRLIARLRGTTELMPTPPKRILLLSAATLLFAAALVCLTSLGGGGYLSGVRVVVTPYTNAVFGRSFESHVIRTIPGVVRLESFPLSGVPPKPGTPNLTNGAGVRIIVAGATPQDARRLANAAGPAFCATARQFYGSTAEVIDFADRATPYSFVRDRLLPGVERLFRRLRRKSTTGAARQAAEPPRPGNAPTPEGCESPSPIGACRTPSRAQFPFPSLRLGVLARDARSGVPA